MYVPDLSLSSNCCLTSFCQSSNSFGNLGSRGLIPMNSGINYLYLSLLSDAPESAIIETTSLAFGAGLRTADCLPYELKGVFKFNDLLTDLFMEKVLTGEAATNNIGYLFLKIFPSSFDFYVFVFPPILYIDYKIMFIFKYNN
jgi:hypothetical protein